VPRITIGIPIYNAEKTLPDALRSVFAQTFQDWELILIDDGSTDRSMPIAKSINDLRVQVVSDGKNKGLATRLNEIVSLAKGDYVARMDADDLMHPERIALQVEHLDAHPAVDVVDTGMLALDNEDNPTTARGMCAVDPRPEKALERAVLSHATVVGRTQWFKENHYDPSFLRAQDYELWVRTVQYSTFSRIVKPLYLCREASVPPFEYLRKYARSCDAVRRIVRKYGPEMVGSRRTAVLIVRSYLKLLVYYCGTLLGKQQAIIDARGRKLTAEERACALSIIERIRHTSVPGLFDIIAQEQAR